MYKTLIATFLLASSGALAQTDPIGCFVPGGCQGSILHISSVASIAECAENCPEHGGGPNECFFFTYLADSGECEEYSTCTLSDTICTNCASGDHGCSLDCYEDGLCQGNVVGQMGSTDFYSCVDFCGSTTGCEYYTYDAADGFCILTDSCDSIDHTCSTCTHGIQECQYLPSTPAASTAGPTTAAPTTAGPTTAGPTTAGPSTAAPTTAGPTTAGAGPTTAAP